MRQSISSIQRRARSEQNTSRIVCTGGSGYVGSVLIPKLVEAGHDVVMVDLVPPHSTTTGVQFEQCDIREIDPGLFEPGDTIIHLAGLSNDATFENDPAIGRSVNVEATLHIGDLAQKAGASHMVFASSCSVYGAIGDQMVDETSPVNGVSDYARAKAECERELVPILAGRTGLTCLRFGTLFGLSPRTRFDLVVNKMTLTAVQDARVLVTGGGRQWRPLLHVSDAARAIQHAVEAGPAPRPSMFNVVGENRSMLQLGETVASKLGVTAEVESNGHVDPRSYCADATRIANELHYQPEISVAAGIDEVYAGLRTGSVDAPVQTSSSLAP